MFSNIPKITLFEIKLLIKVHLILRAGPTEIPNQNLTTFPNLFYVKNPLAVSNFPNELRLKSSFFEINPVAPFCLSFLFLCFQGSVLETEHTPKLVFDD